MDAFNQGGIPHAFVVDGTGRIVWHGHPRGGLDEVLEKLVAREFDAIAHPRTQEEARAAAVEAWRQAEEEFQRGVNEVNAAIAANSETRTICKKLCAPAPQRENSGSTPTRGCPFGPPRRRGGAETQTFAVFLGSAGPE
jgi:hypothetical protein